ncbi:MAG TPA: hypothetical protein VE944_32850 [Nostoc sp.]|uniref:hypothetical protein n=1 Tax=Nostoc sp. TaxID=1180 RepID=UPI002D24D592|nr:hypothetical protein [Nostoc sp.]HYX19058.1 hypothetical protein [Nostoc sp.]
MARELTDKEKKAIAEFERTCPSLGAMAEKNIRSEATGWAEIIAETPDEELIARQGFTSNSFIYKRICG